jgi:hypothetical protein
MQGKVTAVLAVTLTAALWASVAPDAPVRHLGDRRELFVDDWLIATQRGVALQLHPPTPREIAVSFDRPWEGPTTGFVAVLKDGARYRLYYSNDSDGTGPDYTSYAESPDGITWAKPALGLVAYQGSKANNLIWAEKGIFNFNPFRDANPRAKPEERYKALGGGPPRLFVSPDGVRWAKLQDKPVLTDGPFDTQNLAFWDGQRGEYVAYSRALVHGVRAIRTATSPDFVTWSPSRLLDVGGAPAEHLYTNAITPYFRAPHLYIGLPMRFVPDRRLDPRHPYPGISDGVLITSRDGLHFDRYFREAFIRPALGLRNWTDRTNLPAHGIVPTGPEEMSVYWVEHYRHASIRLRRGALRLDGFASVHAPAAGGEFTTHRLDFTGGRLQINFATSATGGVRVAMLNADDTEIPGFGMADCPEMYGNEIEHTVAWTGGSDVRRLAGQRVRLRFAMRDADLYALRFAP